MLEAIGTSASSIATSTTCSPRNRRLREHFNRIVDRKYAAVVALCEGLERQRAMRAAPEEIRALARNVLVVATYWLNFRRARVREARAAEATGAGAYQVMALVAPYLRGARGAPGPPEPQLHRLTEDAMAKRNGARSRIPRRRSPMPATR
jgi:hypothetical protein